MRVGKPGNRGDRTTPRPSLSLSLRLPVALLALLLLTLPARAQQLDARIPADSVAIGEPFELVLTARHDAAARVLFPDPVRGDTVLGDLEVLALADSSHRFEDTAEAGLRVDSVVYRVVTFALDTAFVPPLPVRLIQNQDTVLALTNAVLVPVRSVVPPDAAGIRDMAPLETFGAPWWAWVLLVGAVLLLGGLVAYYVLTRRGAEEAPAPAPEPQRPPYELALERLEQLRGTDLSDPALVKPFYVELSELLRAYLERRTGVLALEETTHELVRDLRAMADQRRLPGDVPERVRRVLTRADLAKFADARPPADENRDALDQTRDVLDAVEEALRPRQEEDIDTLDEAPAERSTLNV